MKTVAVLSALVLAIGAYAVQNSSIRGLGADCTSFSSEEQQFASELNRANRSLFCEKFTPEQREEAMQRAGQMDAQGNILTEDQAVLFVAQKNQIPILKQDEIETPRGSCPIN